MSIMGKLQAENERLVAERDALAALLEKMKFITPEMLRAAQVRSELGAYACSELSGAYSLISEIYIVMVGEFMKQTAPQQCLRDVMAEAGRAGYYSGFKDALVIEPPRPPSADTCGAVDIFAYRVEQASKCAANQYAESVRKGGE